MFKKIVDYLENAGAPYSTNESANIATFLARMDNATFHCILELKESTHLVVFYSAISIIVPEEKRTKIAELLTRINYNLLIGNFEMDFNDGEIRFKTSIDFENVELTDALLANLIGANLSITDDYFYSIIEGVISNASPKEIIDKIEIDDNESESEPKNQN